MKKVVMVVPVLALALSGTTACATKKFVRTSVGEVNSKVDTLSKSVEENQERTKANEAKIADVDQRATAAEAVNSKATALEKASKRIVYEVVLSEDKGNFKFGKAAMPDETKAEIDTLVQKLKAEPNGAFIEIEGHTDSSGTPEGNYRLGMQRAENVKRYIYEQHQVPLHRINVISYGEDKPVAPNNTKQGRAQNRRVVVKVLS